MDVSAVPCSKCMEDTSGAELGNRHNGISTFGYWVNPRATSPVDKSALWQDKSETLWDCPQGIHNKARDYRAAPALRQDESETLESKEQARSGQWGACCASRTRRNRPRSPRRYGLSRSGLKSGTGCSNKPNSVAGKLAVLVFLLLVGGTPIQDLWVRRDLTALDNMGKLYPMGRKRLCSVCRTASALHYSHALPHGDG